MTYAWLLFYCLFARSCETISALKKFLEFFSIKGLQRLRGESVIVAKKELVAVALKHQRSINYIVDKVILTINKIYRARPSEEDKDLAFIVLKLGAPALLDILGKANKLPSSSVAPQLHIVWDRMGSYGTFRLYQEMRIQC